jgi:FkbM family methyltransferase
VSHRQTLTLLSWYLARLIALFWRFGTLRLVKRLPNSTKSTFILHRSFAGAQLYLDVSRADAQGILFLAGERCVAERFLLAKLVTPGMRIADVGGNIGYYTLLLRQLTGPSGAIITIEPSPENLPELRLNIEGNKLQNVKLLEVAVGAESGKVSLIKGMNSGVVPLNEGSYEVPIQTLDEILTERIDLLKIDVEGYEGYVLEGARNVIKRDRPIIFLEFHPTAIARCGHSFESIHALLAPSYSSISYYDVAHPSSAIRKVATNYFGMDSCRQLAGPPAVPMHVGRENGTFWMVCR